LFIFHLSSHHSPETFQHFHHDAFGQIGHLALHQNRGEVIHRYSTQANTLPWLQRSKRSAIAGGGQSGPKTWVFGVSSSFHG
jgi:hypothetical protein